MRPIEAQGLRVSVDTGPPSATFLPVEGLRLTGLQIVNEGVELGASIDDPWRRMLSKGGRRMVDVEASGLLLATPVEDRLRTLSLTGEEADYRLELEQGRELQGRFVITQMTFEAPQGEEGSFKLRLASSGEIVLV